ncbi:hypothetical protein ACJJTC_015670 [Scirpophaga incertulas]
MEVVSTRRLTPEGLVPSSTRAYKACAKWEASYEDNADHFCNQCLCEASLKEEKVAFSRMKTRVLVMVKTVAGDLLKAEGVAEAAFNWINGVPGCGKTEWVISQKEAESDIVTRLL